MSNVSIPEIRINFSWLLYHDVSAKLAEYEGWELPSVDDCEKWTNNYRHEWTKISDKVLTAMQDISGLQFKNSVYDVSTVPGVIAKSDPLVINFKDYPKETMSTLIHELIHVLLTDNTVLSLKGDERDFRLADEWEKLFGFGDDFDALVHVPVHAIHRKIYETVLNNPKMVDADREEMNQNNAESYIKSWEYVKNEGADVIIEKLKNSYAEIAKNLEKKK